jgi:FKBP-type peptidyl-prolyl cis-trans isomerase 2
MEFIKISYTGKVKDGQIFDTTDEESAKKENIYSNERVYKPLSVAVGESQVIAGLDEALKDMKVGDKKTVTIAPEKGYGQKSPAMVKLVPVKVFRQQGMNPVPGMPVEIDHMRGKVQTVAGGRVRVDFNHELAGKTLVFDVEVVDRAKSDEDKVQYLIERNFEASDGFDTKLAGKKLTLKLPKKAFHDRNLLARKASMSAEAFKFLNLSDVTFEETWENPKTEEKKPEAHEEKAPKKGK